MNVYQLIASPDVEEIDRPAASRILATLIEASPLAIVTFDPEGVVTMWNPAAERIFGWSESEALGTRLPFVPAEKQEEFLALRRRALLGEVFTEPELQRRRADGSPIIVSVSTSPLRRPDGTIYGIMSILMDVTEAKAAEESRARLTMAVEQAGESIVVTDTRGTIQYVNPAFERITGYDRMEVIGQNTRILKSGRQDTAFYNALWQSLRRGEVWRGTFLNQRKDGTLFEDSLKTNPSMAEWGAKTVYDAATGATIQYKTFEHAVPERRVALGDSVLAEADAWGQYVFKIRTGTYRITGSCEGYESVTRTVTVEPDGRHYMNFFLPRIN